MRVVTAALLAALVAILSVIAYDLHRLAGIVAPAAAAAPGSIPTTPAAADDHERRVQMYMRMLCNLEDCDRAQADAEKRLRSSRR